MNLNKQTSFIVIFNGASEKNNQDNVTILTAYLKKEGLENDVTLGKHFDTFGMMEMRMAPDIVKKIQAAPNVKSIEKNQIHKAI